MARNCPHRTRTKRVKIKSRLAGILVRARVPVRMAVVVGIARRPSAVEDNVVVGRCRREVQRGRVLTKRWLTVFGGRNFVRRNNGG